MLPLHLVQIHRPLLDLRGDCDSARLRVEVLLCKLLLGLHTQVTLYEIGTMDIMEEITQTKFNGWALVEIMGHRRAAGQVTTEYIGMAAFLRIVTPEVPVTRYTLEKDAWINGSRVYSGSIMESSRPRAEILVGTGSVYAITPIDEGDVLEHAPVDHQVIQMAERQMIAAPEPAPVQDEDDEPGF